MRYLGGYISSAGGIDQAILRAEELQINTMLIHPTPPQKYSTTDYKQEGIDKFNAARKNSKIEKVFFHGVYLINLANPDKQKFHLSKMSLVTYLNLAAAVNCDGVVFHVGSFKDTTEEEGFARIIKGINWIFNESPNSAKLSLEVAAGAGSVVGSKIEDLARIYEGVENKERLNFCLDTQHMFGSGYDLINDLEGVVEKLDSVLGIKNISAVHFNDSKVDFNSKKDRHENLGDGLIGEKAMKAFLNHPKLKHLPFMMETPGMKDPETSAQQVAILKEWAEE